MNSKLIENPDVSAFETGLDANWNERKHLLEREFELRLRVQDLLIKGDPAFAQPRHEEQACKAALLRNDEEYEALVASWSARLFNPRT